MSTLNFEPDYRNIELYSHLVAQKIIGQNQPPADLKSKSDIDECEYLDHNFLEQECHYLELEEGDDNEENYYTTIKEPKSTHSKCITFSVVVCILLIIALTILLSAFFLKSHLFAKQHNFTICESSNYQNRLACQREFVRKMAIDAWHAYRKYSWGQPALKPVSKKANFDWFGFSSGYTIVSAMSTFHTMGLWDQWQEGKRWIENDLKFSDINVNLTTTLIVTDYIGALLSAYALSGEKVFKNKAVEIGNIIKRAFNTTSGI